MMEPFHQDIGVATAHIKNALKDSYDEFQASVSKTYHSILELRQSDPSDYIEEIAKHTTGQFISLKVFPGHLEQQRLRELIRHSAAVAFLRRNPLHSYISARIAERLDVWSGQDTSKIKIGFEKDTFVKWNNHNWRFFENALQLVDETNVAKIDLCYEELLNIDQALNKLQDDFTRAQVPLIISPAKNPNSKVQDSRTSALDKVNNPNHLREIVQQLKIEHLLDAGMPVDTYTRL